MVFMVCFYIFFLDILINIDHGAVPAALSDISQDLNIVDQAYKASTLHYTYQHLIPTKLLLEIKNSDSPVRDQSLLAKTNNFSPYVKNISYI